MAKTIGKAIIDLVPVMWGNKRDKGGMFSTACSKHGATGLVKQRSGEFLWTYLQVLYSQHADFFRSAENETLVLGVSVARKDISRKIPGTWRNAFEFWSCYAHNAEFMLPDSRGVTGYGFIYAQLNPGLNDRFGILSKTNTRGETLLITHDSSSKAVTCCAQIHNEQPYVLRLDATDVPSALEGLYQFMKAWDERTLSQVFANAVLNPAETTLNLETLEMQPDIFTSTRTPDTHRNDELKRGDRFSSNRGDRGYRDNDSGRRHAVDGSFFDRGRGRDDEDNDRSPRGRYRGSDERPSHIQDDPFKIINVLQVIPASIRKMKDEAQCLLAWFEKDACRLLAGEVETLRNGLDQIRILTSRLPGVVGRHSTEATMPVVIDADSYHNLAKLIELITSYDETPEHSFMPEDHPVSVLKQMREYRARSREDQAESSSEQPTT